MTRKVPLLQIPMPAGNCSMPGCINEDGGRNISFLQNVNNSASALSVDDQICNSRNPEASRTNNNTLDGDDNTRAGIKIRPRQTDNQAVNRKIVLQGIASKRIRLQNKLKVRSVSRRLPKSLSFDDKKSDARASHTEVLDLSLFLDK